VTWTWRLIGCSVRSGPRLRAILDDQHPIGARGSPAKPERLTLYTPSEPRSGSPFTRLRAWLACLISEQARDIKAYLEQRPALCPDYRQFASYAATVSTATAQRTAATRARQAAPGIQQATAQAAAPEAKLATAADYLAAAVMTAKRQKGTKAMAAKGAGDALAMLGPEAARLARAARIVVRSMGPEAAATVACEASLEAASTMAVGIIGGTAGPPSVHGGERRWHGKSTHPGSLPRDSGPGLRRRSAGAFGSGQGHGASPGGRRGRVAQVRRRAGSFRIRAGRWPSGTT
jgi:hypothetical protein